MALNINGTTGISGVDGSVSAPAVTGTDSNTGITFPSADTIKFATGGVERMSISNSGVTGTGISNGKLLQWKTSKKTNSPSTTSGTYSEISSDFRITLTPTASDSLIIVQAFLMVNLNNNAGTIRLRRNTATDFSGTSSEVMQPDDFSANEDGIGSFYVNTNFMMVVPIVAYETSGNTTARTYSPFWRTGGGTFYLNRFNNDDYQSVSTFHVIEVGA
tara:strand:- start:562 stop:1212 length:651 start_codon:yes stop_codon:yes gene_type:complete